MFFVSELGKSGEIFVLLLNRQRKCEHMTKTFVAEVAAL